MYDTSNIFWKIIEGKIPAKVIFQNNNAISFFDIAPARKVHAIVIPKGQFITFDDFFSKASIEQKEDFYACLYDSIKKLALKQSGYRLITNARLDGGQEVPHFHFHILGGEKIGKLVSN